MNRRWFFTFYREINKSPLGRWALAVPLLFVILLLLLFAAVGRGLTAADEDIVLGAQLYDKWYAALGVNPPEGNMPIWSRQSTNTRSGADTWRCTECHGWDARGAEGANASGSHYTGFPNIARLTEDMSEVEIVAFLQGKGGDQAHDFSPYLDEAAMQRLAAFLKRGLVDDSQYLNPFSLKAINADSDHGTELYRSTCLQCHGEDGRQIAFRGEGIEESLGDVANRDPWRFLHRTRFGLAESAASAAAASKAMPVGYLLGWSPEDGRDVLAYAQTLPVYSRPNPASGGGEEAAKPLRGGPATSVFTGILTGLGAFAGGIGFAALFIGGFFLVGFFVVTVLRRRD